MISMLGSGNSPGGNNSGGPAAIPINVDSTKFGDKAISKEGAKRNSSVQLDDVPQEYRQALESYYREVEKIID
ncbi:MAG: hypothetical protein HRT88_07455 [Lentisphaeraceae bacterium]|nr:hypothetical protein [Lentisphaeraceae bacterium]